MKIFSALIFFAMLFTCLPAAYADVALPPRPRNVQSGFVTANTDDDKKLTLKFNFPYECDYEYQLLYVWKDSEKNLQYLKICSSSGKCKQGYSIKEVVDLNERLSDQNNLFLLKIKMTNLKEKTCFGTKIFRYKEEVTKTLIVSNSFWGKIYDLRIYDGDRTEH